MIWASAGALAIHLGAALVLGFSFESSGSDHPTDAHQALTVRYVAAGPAPGADPQADSANPSAAALITHSGTTSEDKTLLQGAGAEGGPTRRYFDVSEVDQPAMPTPDWALDAETLVRNGIRSLRVEVLVSDKGRAEKCTVQAMEPPRAVLHQAIARQVCSTRLTPAMRQGVAVPSVRHVEILLTQE
jgi:hypothetical protein